MQSLTPPAGANIATTTPPGSPTQLKTPFHILQTAQTRNLHATELQRQLASFTNARIKLEAQADAFTARWGEGRVGPGVNPDAGHEALLKECRSTLGPAALAAVAPGGFRGALGGYASVQRVAAALSSASNGLARYMADRSTSPSAPPSPLSELVPKEILDRSPAHPEIDESHQPRATDSGSEANAKCGTEHEDHIEQCKSSSSCFTCSAFDFSSRSLSTSSPHRRPKWLAHQAAAMEASRSQSVDGTLRSWLCAHSFPAQANQARPRRRHACGCKLKFTLHRGTSDLGISFRSRRGA